MRGIYRIDRYLLSLLLRIMSIVLRRSDIIICTTVEHRQSLIQRGFDPGKIRVVPNGADTRLFTKGNEAEKDLMRLKYGLPKDSFVLVVMTDAGWQKYRLEPMVIALQKVHQIPNLRNYVLLVVGRWTRELRAYLKLAERTGITVCYVGEIAHDKMPEVLHAADVGLIPLADFEDARHILPVKLFEYCSCKLPVLVTAPSDSLLGRVVSEHSLGLVCQPQDTEAIAEALQRFCTNDKLREEMGKHCRSVIEEEYDRQLLSKRYKTILEGLLARKDRESLGYLPHA
jgi:glycosyltransferase involved in cell wall biosynthesis